MQNRTSERLVLCEKNLLATVLPFFKQDAPAPPNHQDCWTVLASYLEWRLLPCLLRLAPAWPHQQVWCDGVELFSTSIEQPNALRALGYARWLPTDTDAWDKSITAGIEHSELIDIDLRWCDKEPDAGVDYTIKIWTNTLCHQLTPSHRSATPSCSSPLSTPNFDYLLNAIRHPRTQNSAFSIAGVLGGFGVRGAKLLEELLTDTDIAVRCAATQGLQRQGLTAQLTIPLMAKALQDPDPRVQHLTATALWRRLKNDAAFLPLLRQSTPLFLRRFGHEPEANRHWYTHEILAYLSATETSVALAMAVALADETLRLHATKILWHIPAPTPTLLTHYQAALSSENIRWRTAAAFSLWRFGSDFGNAFIAVSEDGAILQDPGIVLELLHYDYNSAIALIPYQDAVSTLGSILQRHKTHQRIWCQAAETLAKIYDRTADHTSRQLLQTLVPKLLHPAQDNDKRIQRCALNALGAIGADAKAALPALLIVIYNPDLDGLLRGAAAEAVVNIGPDAKTAVALFSFFRQQDNYSLNSQALPILKPLGHQAIPVLVEALQSNTSEDIYSDYGIWDRLAEFGTDALPALATLSQHEKLRVQALSALGKTHDKAASAYVLPFLTDVDSTYRSTAASALGELGERAIDAVSALAEAINDTDLEVCAHAIEALGKIGAQALPALLAAVDGADDFTLDWIGKALGDIGGTEAALTLEKLPDRA